MNYKRKGGSSMKDPPNESRHLIFIEKVNVTRYMCI